MSGGSSSSNSLPGLLAEQFAESYALSGAPKLKHGGDGSATTAALVALGLLAVAGAALALTLGSLLGSGSKKKRT